MSVLILQPVLVLAGLFCGYRIYPGSLVLLTLTIALPPLVTAVLSIRHQPPGRVVFLTPLAMCNVALCLLFWKRTPETVATFIALGSCVFLTLKCGRRIPEKIIPLILTGTMGMYILIFSVLGSIGVRIPVQSLPSPDGSRCARIINSDQGATGGDTLVEVVEETNLLLYRVEKRQRVYVGPWGHWEAMQIRWKNDHCLVIDGTEYEV